GALVDAAAAADRPKGALGRGAVVLGDVAMEGLPEHFLGRVAQHLGHDWADESEAARAVDRVDDVATRLEDRAVAFLGGGEGPGPPRRGQAACRHSGSRAPGG